MLKSVVFAAATLWATGALAQAAGSLGATDCAKARDPARCDARQAAIAACADERGAKKRQCIENKMPPVDCSKAQDPARCAERQKAREACKDKVGKAHKQCLRAQGPKQGKASGKTPAAATGKN